VTTLRVRLGDDETALLERLVAAHPRPLRRIDCDGIAVGNLVAIGCATLAGPHVYVTASGVALWATRTTRPPAGGGPA
jgi:hypothetical protein